MARKHNSKKDSQAKARARKEATKVDESPAKEHLQQRHAEEQAKMDENAVKDVLLDPNFTPVVVGRDDATSSKVPPENPDWDEKMEARGKIHTPAKSKDIEGPRAALTRGSARGNAGKVDADRVAANKPAAVQRGTGRAAKPARGAKATRTTKTATRRKAGTTKAGV